MVFFLNSEGAKHFNGFSLWTTVNWDKAICDEIMAQKLVRIVFPFTAFYYFEELVMMNRQLDGAVNQEERSDPAESGASLEEQRSNKTPITSESIDEKKGSKSTSQT